MILYNREGWEKIKDNSYLFQEDIGFANTLYKKHLFFSEENIVNIVKSKFNETEDGVFIDVGANVGTYTITLGKVFSHTVAFEPLLNTYNIMCGNVAIHGLSDKTTLINCALLDSDKEVFMHGYDILGSLTHITEQNTDIINDNLKTSIGYEYSKKIYTKTLDSFNIKNVKLIKIDVEGNELSVLKGAEKTLKQSNYPMLILESWTIGKDDNDELKQYKENLRKELFDYVKNIGYIIEETENDEVFICEYRKQKHKTKTIFY